jgi:hypothetical protein
MNPTGFEHLHCDYDFSVLDKYAVMLDPDTAPCYGKDKILTRYGKKAWAEYREQQALKKKKYRSIDDLWEPS